MEEVMLGIVATFLSGFFLVPFFIIFLKHHGVKKSLFLRSLLLSVVAVSTTFLVFLPLGILTNVDNIGFFAFLSVKLMAVFLVAIFVRKLLNIGLLDALLGVGLVSISGNMLQGVSLAILTGSA